MSFVLSEDIATNNLNASDLWLREVHSNQFFSLSNFFYNTETRTVSVTTPNLSEGVYEINLNSDLFGFRDLVGNLLDGNADGTAGDTYTLRFAVDKAASTAPTLTSQAPAGSLVYRAEVADLALHGVSDTDSFTFTLAPGQTLSLMASPTAGLTRMALELFDATTGGNSLGLFEASTLGQTALLQTLAIGGGNYRVEVRSLEGSGKYTLQAASNGVTKTLAIDATAVVPPVVFTFP